VVISAVLFLFVLSPIPTLLNCLVIAMCLIDDMGYMYFWGIDLNAVSLVNLVVSIGVTVEFTSYIAKTFAESKEETSTERARDAMLTLGASVFNGSFATLISIVVLAFAQYYLIVEYYFKMYFVMILFGIVHGLVFLPVLLATLGYSIIDKTDKYHFGSELVPPTEMNESLNYQKEPGHSEDKASSSQDSSD